MSFGERALSLIALVVTYVNTANNMQREASCFMMQHDVIHEAVSFAAACIAKAHGCNDFAGEILTLPGVLCGHANLNKQTVLAMPGLLACNGTSVSEQRKQT